MINDQLRSMTQRKESEMPRTRNAKVTPVTDDEVTETETEAPAEVTFSAKDLAAELGIDAKSFRRWLRSHTTDRAEKGGRWIFTEETKGSILAAYNDRSNKGTEPTLEVADDADDLVEAD